MKLADKSVVPATIEKQASEVTIVDEHTIQDKIYEVRGVKIMLDFELAEIYGYETKYLNRQVKNNAARFEGDEFMFRLTREELEELSRCKNFTTIQSKGVKGGSPYLPYAFTEQGVYMLMTVLKGNLAIRQSRALVMAFKAMKDYIIETQGLASQRDVLRLSMQTMENTEAIRNLQSTVIDQQRLLADQQKAILEIDDQLMNAREQLDETVKKSDISPVMLKFDLPEDAREFLIREGHPVKADVAYMDIYSNAKKSVYIIDNYINLKTLRLLQNVKSGVSVTVFSDNLYSKLHASDYADFQVEFPTIPITFVTTGGIMHDRFIVLDYGNADERIFHCGASSKDAAVKLTTAITEMMSDDMKKQIHLLIDQMKRNPPLILR